MTLLLLLRSAVPGNTVTVTATQTPATASVALRETFVAVGNARQAPATSAATLTERFLVASAASQAPATASAQLSTPANATLAITAVQAPHGASLSLGNPSAVQMTGGGGGPSVPRLIYAPRTERSDYYGIRLRVTATQQGHTASAALGNDEWSDVEIMALLAMLQ